MTGDEADVREKYVAPKMKRTALKDLPSEMRGELVRLVSEMAAGMEPAGDCRVVLDLEGRFKEVSKEFCGLVGYEQRELLGKRIDDITASRTVDIPGYLGAVVNFGQFRSLWMFAAREGRAILARGDWKLLPDMSMEVRFEALPSPG
jgi:PAS domain-containing protein